MGSGWLRKERGHEDKEKSKNLKIRFRDGTDRACRLLGYKIRRDRVKIKNGCQAAGLSEWADGHVIHSKATAV